MRHQLQAQLAGFSGKTLLLVLLSMASISQAQDTTLRTKAPKKSEVSDRAMTLRWKSMLRGGGLTSETEEINTVGARFYLDWKYQVHELVYVRTEGFARLESDRKFIRDADNATGLFLRQAYVALEPIRALHFSAGALDQGLLGMNALVSERPFPGIQERTSCGDEKYEKFCASLTAQQTIPTSRTLSTEAAARDPSPYFLWEKLDLTLKTWKPVTMSAMGGHFLFKGLAAKVAADSELYGNTILTPGPNSSRFEYEFGGWFAGLAAKANFIPRIKPELRWQIIENAEAPTAFNQSQMVTARTPVHVSSKFQFIPQYTVWYTESDVGPSYYADRDLGGNNRQGYSPSLSLEFPKNKFRVVGSFSETTPINPNRFQSREQIFFLKFETAYDNI